MTRSPCLSDSSHCARVVLRDTRESAATSPPETAPCWGASGAGAPSAPLALPAVPALAGRRPGRPCTFQPPRLIRLTSYSLLKTKTLPTVLCLLTGTVGPSAVGVKRADFFPSGPRSAASLCCFLPVSHPVTSRSRIRVRAEHPHPSLRPLRRPVVTSPKLGTTPAPAWNVPTGSAHGPCPAPRASVRVTPSLTLPSPPPTAPWASEAIPDVAFTDVTQLCGSGETPEHGGLSRLLGESPAPSAAPDPGSGPRVISTTGDRGHWGLPTPHTGAARSGRSPVFLAHRPARLPARRAPCGVKRAPMLTSCPRHPWVGPDWHTGPSQI